ncbi:hypothetical protein ALC57_06964 [Trachymyrmex cornetzi]|uniref:Uncharacterized protein n=1 Tax=Trachymyrmex cornetzi TaxID=471704 RepID=A0A195E706_9HYME|nr:hypothetical protein ALC57_06964 [Trachymyrmex cornetzi]
MHERPGSEKEERLAPVVNEIETEQPPGTVRHLKNYSVAQTHKTENSVLEITRATRSGQEPVYMNKDARD